MNVVWLINQSLVHAEVTNHALHILSQAKPARQFGHAMQIKIIIIIHFFRNYSLYGL